MASLKDIIAKDLAVFYNISEFAEEHEINGKVIPIISDSELLKSQKLKLGDGIYKVDMVFRVQASEFGSRPAIGSHLTFDGKKRRVADYSVQDGEYIITLEDFKS